MVENNNSVLKTLARRIRNLQGQRDTLMEMVNKGEERILELEKQVEDMTISLSKAPRTRMGGDGPGGV